MRKSENSVEMLAKNLQVCYNKSIIVKGGFAAFCCESVGYEI